MVNRDIEFYMDELQSHIFFQELTIDEIALIERHAQIYQFRKGQILFFQEEPLSFTYYLFKGLIKMEASNETGDYHYVDYVSPNTFIPYGEVLSDRAYQYSATAVTDIDIMRIPLSNMRQIMHQNHKQLIYMYNQMADILYFHEKRVQVTSLSSAWERVILSLSLWMKDMGLQGQTSYIIPYNLTMNELATFAGTTRETTSRVVNSLADEGKLNFSRQKIEFFDVDYFKSLLE